MKRASIRFSAGLLAAAVATTLVMPQAGARSRDCVLNETLEVTGRVGALVPDPNNVQRTLYIMASIDSTGPCDVHTVWMPAGAGSCPRGTTFTAKGTVKEMTTKLVADSITCH
jgi:hypothetical protein